MNNEVYYLSDDQLALLGTLLNGSILYEVNSDLFSTFMESYERKVEDTLQQLEDKKMIKMNYDGTISIQPDIYDLIEVLIQPTQLLILEKVCFDGTHEKHVYYQYKNRVLHINKGRIYHRVSFETTAPFLANSPLVINETISNKTLQTVNDFIDWFDDDAAMDCLKGSTLNANLVMDIIQKKHDELRATYYHWVDDQNILSQDVIVGFMNEQVFEWQEKNGEVHIRGGFENYHAILEKMFKEVER